MILTVTINPLLEVCLHYSHTTAPESRNGKLTYGAGGKGINVSRQLKHLGMKSFGFTFSGGANGKMFRSVLEKEELQYSFVRTESEMRLASVIHDEARQKTESYFQENNPVTGKEVDEFLSKLDKMIQNCEMVILSGSSPSQAADQIFPKAIELAHTYDKISILDTYGTHLQACLDASPTIIHNNISEIENSLKLSLSTEKEKFFFLDEVYQKGIKQAFLTDGEKPTYFANFDFHYKVIPPQVKSVHPTGSGDAFVAGIAYGWHHDFVFEETCKTATALGVLNATRFDVCAVPPNDITRLKNKIEIIPVGKKMKLLDDSPQ